MSIITTTTTDDLMNSYAALITETLPHNNNNPELQLSINDLVNPTEKAETLLETLSNEQLNVIEQTLFKIKERKLGTPTGGDRGSLSASSNTILVQDIPNNNNNNNTGAITVTVNTKSSDMSTVTSGTSSSESQDWDSTATKVAKALANVISMTSNEKDQDPTTNNATITQSNKCTKPPNNNSHEPTTELREGIEWVSFVYSHHRTLRRYCIRTDLDKVDTSILDDKFKKENCVYPRANLPRESYRGNRWAYETECNVLGWKLAYLNMEEIAGKRGLIQRAVDSYRNRYPSMRSRRVARQEKLLKGTLRKRKQHKEEPQQQQQQQEQVPKTILIEENNESKCRIRINIESVVLDAIDNAFRKNNCVFPRSMNIHPGTTPTVSQRRLDEAKCNEIGWKLAWLNPRQLANKKNLLQRALDIYRSQFTTDLKPRKYTSRVPPAPFTTEEEKKTACSEDVNMEDVDISKQDDHSIITTKSIPLTEQALANQQKELMELDHATNNNSNPHNFAASASERRNSVSGQSCYSGTTVTLDFHDYCFSPPAEEEDDEMESFEDTLLSTAANSPNYMSVTMFDDLVALGSSLEAGMLRQDKDTSSLSDNNKDAYDNTMSQQNSPSPNYSSTSSASNNTSCSSSTSSSSNNNNQVESLSMLSLNEMYQQALLLDPTATLFNNSNTAATSKEDEDTTIFDTGFGDANQLLSKYENVNAGMDDFTGPLLSRLF
ncbi:hypothetical protein K501DRAFT_336093 [Backusella circina FSU 941]|nr:hypothetical protein K501DRAFT_336093 [Backusella circina FSU 941]